MSISFQIRREKPEDERDIWHVTKRAFAAGPYADGDEQDLVDALRACGALTISLVAEDRGTIIGHVAFSPVMAEDSSSGWYALGPVAVEPALQRQGVGKQLIRAGIARLRELSASGCILVGDPNYYSQFGFVLAPENAPASVPAEYFMVLSLGNHAPKCRMDFHEAFHQKR